MPHGGYDPRQAFQQSAALGACLAALLMMMVVLVVVMPAMATAQQCDR